jgi:hypothetical protein
MVGMNRMVGHYRPFVKEDLPDSSRIAPVREAA